MLLETLPNPTPIDRFRYYEDERFGAALAAVPGRVVVSDPRDYTDSFVPQGGAYVYVDVTARGNGTVDPLEGCDDGNGTDGDGCDANCHPTADPVRIHPPVPLSPAADAARHTVADRCPRPDGSAWPSSASREPLPAPHAAGTEATDRTGGSL
jgi:cysteine-rich repeat protein